MSETEPDVVPLTADLAGNLAAIDGLTDALVTQ
jgi:hypothetical protein